MPFWAVHGDGRRLPGDATVAAEERLSWPLTVGFGMQYFVAVAAATLLVPALTGLSPATTLLFSGLGTLAFLLVTRHRLPAYLGSSVAFVAPLQAASAAGLAAQLGGVLMVGLVLAAVGVAVKAMGNRVIDALMPPVVAGAVVLLVGLSLAPAAVRMFERQPWAGALTVFVVLLAAAVLPGMGGRFAVLAGVAAGWLVTAIAGGLDPARLSAVGRADWAGLPELAAPQITPTVALGMLPVVIVLVAENIAAVRAVGAVTGRSVDGLTGDALLANGLATTVAGLGGGAGTTVYPQGIGVMAASRVFSTACYAVAGLAAVVLSFSPKAAAVLLTVPAGVLGGASLVLYGLIGVHGAKIWLDARVDLADPLTLLVAATAVVAGVGDLGVTVGSVQVGGVVWGSAAIMLLYPLLRGLRRLVPARGPLPEPLTGSVIEPVIEPGIEPGIEPLGGPEAAPGPAPLAMPEPRFGRGTGGGIGWQLGQK
ncbi:MAG TPA: solute carrier family 23 protein [Pseudonocardiaceae bacterium]